MQREQKRSSWPAFLLTSLVAAVMLLGPNTAQSALGIDSQSPSSERSNVVVLGGQAPAWTVSVDLADAGYECSTQLGEQLQDETVRCSGPNVQDWSFSTDWREGFSEEQTDLVLRRSLRASTRQEVSDTLSINTVPVPSAGDGKLTAHVSQPLLKTIGTDGQELDTIVVGFTRPDALGAMVLVTLRGRTQAELNTKTDLIISNARLED